MNSESQTDILQNDDGFTDISSFTWENKIYCFAGCMILSLLCSLLGSPLLIVGKLTEFSIMISLGAILSILGTLFLSGPIKQLKKMADPTRLVASLLYFAMIAMTLIAGFTLKSPPLAIVCIIGQYLAMMWYSITYIPYARNLISACLPNFLICS